jgi:hypothetical protein
MIDVLVVIAILVVFALGHALLQRWAGSSELNSRQQACSGWTPR